MVLCSWDILLLHLFSLQLLHLDISCRNYAHMAVKLDPEVHLGILSTLIRVRCHWRRMYTGHQSNEQVDLVMAVAPDQLVHYE